MIKTVVKTEPIEIKERLTVRLVPNLNSIEVVTNIISITNI